MESSAERQLEESSSYKRNLTDFPVPFTSPILNSTNNVNHLEGDVMGVAATSTDDKMDNICADLLMVNGDCPNSITEGSIMFTVEYHSVVGDDTLIGLGSPIISDDRASLPVGSFPSVVITVILATIKVNGYNRIFTTYQIIIIVSPYAID
jgi:hypothetical protein